MIDNLTLLYENKTLLESMFLATYAVDDLCSGTKLSLRSQRILCTILSSLNSSLRDATGQQSYSTIFIILILLFAAESFRDFDAVSTHLDGLRRLLELRETKPVPLDYKLLFKIQQVDLRMSLATGRPLYFPFDYSYLQQPVGVIRPTSITAWLMVHPALMSCYQTLQYLSNQANQYRSSKSKRNNWLDFQSQVSTSQTLLIGLGKGHLPIVSKALRLGMLAFLSTLSRSPARKSHLPTFSSQLEECYLAMQREQDSYIPLLIWLMLMGYMSTIDTSSIISSSVWKSIVETYLSWQDARRTISGFPWINMIHDEPGRRSFRHLQDLGGNISKEGRMNLTSEDMLLVCCGKDAVRIDIR